MEPKFKVGDNVKHIARKPIDYGVVIKSDEMFIKVKWNSGHTSNTYTQSGSVNLGGDATVELLTPLEKAMF